MKAEDFPWGELLKVRAKLVHWLRLYGNEGGPMKFEQIARAISCDPVQAELIYETVKEETSLEPVERRRGRGLGTRRKYSAVAFHPPREPKEEP